VTERILTLRQLNRATLARQMLLTREPLSISAAAERLVGLQAQQAQPPFVGLWTRLPDFQRDDLARLIEDRTVVKATWIRATLHLVTAADYLRFRTTLHSMLTGASTSIIQRRGIELDIDTIHAEARRFIGEQPRTFAEITAHFAELMPDTDIGSIRYSIRTHLPLVQVPISTGWSYPGNPKFTLAESWLSRSISPEDKLRELIFRYLAAFGPATVADIQTWSGLAKLKETVEKLKPDLVVYRDEKKRELLDLPDMPLPDEDTLAPERFLPEFDNLLLSHDKRQRVIADEHRKRVYLPALRVAATILVDGFVRGAWKVERSKGTAALVIEPFAPLTSENHRALTEEGERLIRFVEADARTYEVRFAY